ncbi:hypothetical protein GCM10028777_02600 [Angustibacter speluncae]
MKRGDVLWLPWKGGGFPLVVVHRRPRKAIFIARAFAWLQLPDLSRADFSSEIWVGLTHDGAVKDGTWSPMAVDAPEHVLGVPTFRSPAPGGRWVPMTVGTDDPNEMTAAGEPQYLADVSHLPTDDLFDPWLLASKLSQAATPNGTRS